MMKDSVEKEPLFRASKFLTSNLGISALILRSIISLREENCIKHSHANFYIFVIQKLQATTCISCI